MFSPAVINFARPLFLCLALLAGCGTAGKVAQYHEERAERYRATGQWTHAVIEYRKAYEHKPMDLSMRTRLARAEAEAAEYYYRRGTENLRQAAHAAAIADFQQGLIAAPGNEKLAQALAEASARREAYLLYTEAIRLIEAGRQSEARQNLTRALTLYAGFKEATETLASLTPSADKQPNMLEKYDERGPITLSFRQTDIRAAYEFISKSFDVNIVFEDTVRNTPITLFAKNVRFQEAIYFLGRTTKTFVTWLNANTLIVAQDSKDKREQYEDQLIRTFHLSNARAKDMADLIKGVVAVKKVSVNEALNSMTVRDNAEVLRLVEKLVENNDRKSPELLLEVEIIEVNRSKAERLGVDLGTYEIQAGLPVGNTIPLTHSIAESLKNNVVLSIPTAVLRFYKQDVDAKTLANPRLRAVNGKAAKIHIGDRVPLRSSTISDPTGQVRTTYEYKDVGIRLSAEATVNLDNSALVKLGLEISSLGENLGTAAEPAFRIGTRNAESTMILRDGETAVLGGLIRDEERRARVGIPLLGDIPALGRLFSVSDDGGGRTDILLTITPHIVRGWDLPPVEAQTFYSGAGETYSTVQIFNASHTDNVEKNPINDDATPSLTPDMQENAPENTPDIKTDPVTSHSAPVVPENNAAASDAGEVTLRFDQELRAARVNEIIEVNLIGENMTGIVQLPVRIQVNPHMARIVSWENGDLAQPDTQGQLDNATAGELNLIIKLDPQAGAASGSLARLRLSTLKTGVSGLLIQPPQGVVTAQGATTHVKVVNARLLAR